MALQQSANRNGQHHCRDCGIYFESSKSLDVHLQYHEENLLTKWASQAASSAATQPDTDNNNVKSRREFVNSIAAPADSTEMKTTSGPGRPNSNSSYPPTTSPFTHPHTPNSFSSAPSPYQNDIQRFSPSNAGPSPSGSSFGFQATPTETGYQVPFNGYPSSMRSPCPQPNLEPGFILEQQQQQQQEAYILGPNSDFPTTAAGMRATTPNSPSSSTSFRYMYKKPDGAFSLDKNGVSSSSPSTFRSQSPHQCEKCGFVCDSQTTLADHLKAAHPPSPPYQSGSAFQTPDFYRAPEIKTEPGQESQDILDLDSQQKVHNFRPPDEESSTISTPNPHSVSSMLSPWTNNLKTPYPTSQPFSTHSTNPQQTVYHQANGPIQPQTPTYQQTQRNFQETFTNNVPQASVPTQSITTTQIPNVTSPKQTSNSSGKGDSWKSNEARRPKTYNCSACNKWFTSSGHLKRHYNTTLHKNAVKQSGQPDPATLPISSHHHPNRDPNYILSSKTPPGMSNPPPNLALPKPKKSKTVSPHIEANSTPSPALSNTNTEGDSSRSNDTYERSGPGLPNGGFDRHLQPSFGNGCFEMIQTTQSSAFDRTSNAVYERQSQPAFEQRSTQQNFDRTTPQGFDRTTPGFDPRSGQQQNGAFDNRAQNGFTIPEVNRPGSNPNSLPAPTPQSYDYYRDYNRIPAIHNQINSTNQMTAQPPNSLAGPSVSPSGGLPICPPSLLFLRTPNLTNIYMGENITIQRINDQHSQALGLHTIRPSTNNHTTTGDEQAMQNMQAMSAVPNVPLPSFSNFQSSMLNTFTPNYQMDEEALQSAFTVNQCLVPKSFIFDSPSATSVADYTSCTPNQYTDFPSGSADLTDISTNHYPFVKVENIDVGDDFSNVKLDYDTNLQSEHKVVKAVSEKECQTPFSFSPYYSETRQRNFRIKEEQYTPPNSPEEIPTSTNLEMFETKKPKAKKSKAKKNDDSSNLVSSTGSPQPLLKRKEVIRCEECDKTFNRICYLTQHNKSFHCGEKPFKCDRCGKRFHSEKKAKDHSKKHGGVKPFRCEICPKSFNHKTDLRRHLCLHTGKKPFCCDVCGKGFIRKDHMLKHFHTHKSGKRKFIPGTDDLEPAKEEKLLLQQ